LSSNASVTKGTLAVAMLAIDWLQGNPHKNQTLAINAAPPTIQRHGTLARAREGFAEDDDDTAVLESAQRSNR
jgi:hypothetical protein